MINIFVITVSYNFQGTTYVTGLMLLATLWLLLWDLGSFQFIFRNPVMKNLHVASSYLVIEHPFWMFTGILMLSAILVMAFLRVNSVIQLGSAFVIGLVAFVMYCITLRRQMRSSFA